MIPNFERLVATYTPLVFAAALKVLRVPDQVEDVVQATWGKAWRAWQGGLPACPEAWLRKVARREALLLLRARTGRGKEKRQFAALTDEVIDRISDPDTRLPGRERKEADDPARSTERREAARTVLDHLERLPGQERCAVRMYHLDDASYDEIAAALRVPRGSVGALLTRARARLRGWLGDDPASFLP
jgi:RNA polymerase sigma-70 factor (ECF subfamily)